MKSFTVKLEGLPGCGKDTFMNLVAAKLRDVYNFHRVPPDRTTFGLEHVWEVEQKDKYDMYSKISEATNLSRSDVKKVIQAFTYSIEHD